MAEKAAAAADSAAGSCWSPLAAATSADWWRALREVR